jgi:hypothetical protein
MQLRKACTIGCLLVGAALAQTEDRLRSKIATVYYPPLAELARIQGNVCIKVNSDVVTLVSGHPLLAPMATENAKTFGSFQGQANLDVTYHFVLVDTVTSVPTSTTVKEEMAVLRVFRFKTEKVVHTYRCEEGVTPANDIKNDGAVIEIWIYGRTRCLQTDTAGLVATLALDIASASCC